MPAKSSRGARMAIPPCDIAGCLRATIPARPAGPQAILRESWRSPGPTCNSKLRRLVLYPVELRARRRLLARFALAPKRDRPAAMENAEPVRVDASAPGLRFRYFDLVMAAFVTILLLSNLIGASKPSYIALPNGAQWPFGAGVLSSR